MIVNSPPEINNGMATEKGVGIQTRDMTEAQCIEEEAQRHLDNNPGQVQGKNPVAATGQGIPNPGPPKPAMNPTVDLHKNDDKIIEEFIRRHGAIGLDWYVPNFSNTRVGDLSKDKLPIKTTRGKIRSSNAMMQILRTFSKFP